MANSSRVNNEHPKVQSQGAINVKSRSTSASQQMASFIRTRLRRTKQRNRDLTKKVMQARDSIKRSRERIKRLQHGIKVCEDALPRQLCKLDEARETLQGAQDDYKLRQRQIKQLREHMKCRVDRIKNEEKSIQAGQGSIRRLNEDIKNLNDIRSATAVRQTGILGLMRTKVERLANHADFNRSFREEVSRAGEGTATRLTKRDIKRERYLPVGQAEGDRGSTTASSQP